MLALPHTISQASYTNSQYTLVHFTVWLVPRRPLSSSLLSTIVASGRSNRQQLSASVSKSTTTFAAPFLNVLRRVATSPFRSLNSFYPPNNPAQLHHTRLASPSTCLRYSSSQYWWHREHWSTIQQSFLLQRARIVTTGPLNLHTFSGPTKTNGPAEQLAFVNSKPSSFERVSSRHDASLYSVASALLQEKELGSVRHNEVDRHTASA